MTFEQDQNTKTLASLEGLAEYLVMIPAEAIDDLSFAQKVQVRNIVNAANNALKDLI